MPISCLSSHESPPFSLHRPTEASSEATRARGERAAKGHAGSPPSVDLCPTLVPAAEAPKLRAGGTRTPRAREVASSILPLSAAPHTQSLGQRSRCNPYTGPSLRLRKQRLPARAHVQGAWPAAGQNHPYPSWQMTSTGVSLSSYRITPSGLGLLPKRIFKGRHRGFSWLHLHFRKRQK